MEEYFCHEPEKGQKALGRSAEAHCKYDPWRGPSLSLPGAISAVWPVWWRGSTGGKWVWSGGKALQVFLLTYVQIMAKWLYVHSKILGHYGQILLWNQVSNWKKREEDGRTFPVAIWVETCGALVVLLPFTLLLVHDLFRWKLTLLERRVLNEILGFFEVKLVQESKAISRAADMRPMLTCLKPQTIWRHCFPLDVTTKPAQSKQSGVCLLFGSFPNMGESSGYPQLFVHCPWRRSTGLFMQRKLEFISIRFLSLDAIYSWAYPT